MLSRGVGSYCLHYRRARAGLEVGDDFFEGSREVAGTQASNRVSTPTSDLRNDLRQNRTNLLTIRASPPAPALAPVGQRRQKCQNRRRKVEKPAVPRQNPGKWRRGGEKSADPRQKCQNRRRRGENSSIPRRNPRIRRRRTKKLILLCGKIRRVVPTFQTLAEENAGQTILSMVQLKARRPRSSN